MNIRPEENQPVSILFRFQSEVLDQEVIEIMRAETVKLEMGKFKILDIPFYTPGIATDDIIHAEYDDSEEMLAYRETLTASGNSTVWIVITNEDTPIEEIQEIFLEMDCDSEEVSERFFAMEVKSTTNYLRVRDMLNKLKSEGIIDFAEPCLSDEHQY
jgi:Domain of unknown function (DUF4265)